MAHTGFLASWDGAGLDSQVLQRVRQVLEGRAHDSAAMAPFSTTVVRCCSKEHEEVSAEVVAAAAAARASEAAAVEMCYGEGQAGRDESLDEEAIAEVAAAVLRMSSSGEGKAGSSSENIGGANGGGSSSGCGDGASASDAASEQQLPFRILVTGHSLGGSVGTLCAFDLARQLPQWGYASVLGPNAPASASSGGTVGAMAPAAAPAGGSGAQVRPIALSVYTFGAPRTGNHAFAREYGEAVPDSWAVINDQDLGEQSGVGWVGQAWCLCLYRPPWSAVWPADAHQPSSRPTMALTPPPLRAVAKEAKFLVLFKRPGHVALMTPRGDLLVNPSERVKWACSSDCAATQPNPNFSTPTLLRPPPPAGFLERNVLPQRAEHCALVPVSLSNLPPSRLPGTQRAPQQRAVQRAATPAAVL